MKILWKLLRPLALLVLLVLLTLSLSRLALVGLLWARVAETNALAHIVVQGWRFDFVLLGMLLVLPLLLMPVLATSNKLLPVWKFLLTAWVPLMVMLVVFMELATPAFAEQFDARPNVLFFEYMNHPAEVLATLWGAYRLPLLAGITVVVFIGFFLSRYVTRMTSTMRAIPLWSAVLSSVLLVLLSAACVRSTLGHRPVNPSTVAVTQDALVNELALSSTYTVAYAAYELRNEKKGGFRYSSMDALQATETVKRGMQIEQSEFMSTANSTMHQFTASRPAQKPKNLVIILEESLGAEFVGSLGGLDLTPNLDALKNDGIWFEHLYATGTRSVRGIEAVISGFPPTPARSIVKLGKSQRDFFTLASFLGAAGFNTSFIYGGEAHFDNMRRFFVNNGFAHIIDENDYVNPVFTGSWGVSDEDLFARAHEHFSSQGDQPFFSLVFSSSNHTPFEFPDGRIELYDEEKQTVNNAVKYADFALGEFLDNARQSNYWDNTVFLVVADHNSRIYGADLIPIERFHIPGVILGGSIEPGVYDKVASQIDLAPTLLSLIGVSGEHPMIGDDLTRQAKDRPGRAIMQFNTIQAYMEDSSVVVMQKDLGASLFDYIDGHLEPAAAANPELVNKALAHSVWASHAYQESLYGNWLPQPASSGISALPLVMDLAPGSAMGLSTGLATGITTGLAKSQAALANP